MEIDINPDDFRAEMLEMYFWESTEIPEEVPIYIGQGRHAIFSYKEFPSEYPARYKPQPQPEMSPSEYSQWMSENEVAFDEYATFQCNPDVRHYRLCSEIQRCAWNLALSGYTGEEISRIIIDRVSSHES